MSPYHLAYAFLAVLAVMGGSMIFHAPPADSRTMMGGILTALAASLIKLIEVIEKCGVAYREKREEERRKTEDDQTSG